MTSASIHAVAVQSMEIGDGCIADTSGFALRLDPRVVSGSLGSVVAALVSQPFEVAKIKVQTRGATAVTGSFGTLATLRHLIANEGVKGVYAGLAPTLAMSVPSYVLYLTIYDEMVVHLKRTNFVSPSSDAVFNNSIPLLGGAVARLIATIAVAPLELLRTRDASMKHPRGGTQTSFGVFSDLTTIVRNEGAGALYKGIAPALGRDVPFAAVYMLCLERFRDMSRPLWSKVSSDSNSTSREVAFEFTNAAFAGMVAATCTAPLDRVKTFKQSAPTAVSVSGHNMTTFGVLRSILCKEGVGGLWRGNQARMMKVAPQYAVMISSYEVGKKVLSG